MISKTIKEIILMLLVCLVTMLILAIALYQYIPSKKIVPEIAQYKASETVQDLLEDDIDSRTNKDNIILTYEVTSSDLNNYQITDDYVPGKSNPFAAYTTTTTTTEESNGKETATSNNEEDINNTSKQVQDSAESSYSQNKGIK